MDEFAWMDAVRQAELIRLGEVTALELVDAAIARIEARAVLNAVVTPTFELARASARGVLPEGPLAGVPFLVKDFCIEWAGVRFTEGSRCAGDYVSPADQELAARYRRAGLVLCGKTNTSEFGLTATTEPARFGPTLNPWDHARSPGGSSGGSAAAVAAGLVAVAHGNDGAGSLRQPAAWCGVFGLKPTRGRNPLGPRYGDLAAGLVAEHALSRTVRDSAAILDATRGPAPGEPYVIEAPKRPYLLDAIEDPRPLRIAVTTTPFIDVDVDTGMRGHDAVSCRTMRCPRTPRHRGPPRRRSCCFERHFLGVWAAVTAWIRIDWEERLGRRIERDEFEPLAWTLAQNGAEQSAGQHLKNVQELQRVARTVAQFFGDFDVLLTPVAAVATLPLASFIGRAGFVNARRSMAFTMLANATGQPAMSIPMDPTPDGLPAGAHFMARLGDEATLFQLAGQLERAHPWQHRHPPTPPTR